MFNAPAPKPGLRPLPQPTVAQTCRCQGARREFQKNGRCPTCGGVVDALGAVHFEADPPTS